MIKWRAGLAWKRSKKSKRNIEEEKKKRYILHLHHLAPFSYSRSSMIIGDLSPKVTSRVVAPPFLEQIYERDMQAL